MPRLVKCTLSRRSMLGAAAAFSLAPMTGFAAGAKANGAKDIALFAGTTVSDKSNGALYPLRFRPRTGELIAGTPFPDIANVTFGTYSRKFGLHYLSDRAKSRIEIYRASPDGAQWSHLGGVASGGENACYVSLDAAEKVLAAAHYNSGNLVLFHLDPATGMPLDNPINQQDVGSGPNTARQAGPHCHWVRFSPDQRFVYNTDLGSDEILANPYDAAHASIGERFVAFKAAPGNGPRHLAFHPRLPLCYLVSELGNTLTVLKRLADGKLERLQMLATVPEDFKGQNAASHIAVNAAGTRVYVSNRGHNSIAVFALGRAGQAAVKQFAASGGDGPRIFLPLEESGWMIVANQVSGEVVPFRIAKDGSLAPGGKAVTIPMPGYLGRVVG
jgi:6-phosphogluconolactonase